MSGDRGWSESASSRREWLEARTQRLMAEEGLSWTDAWRSAEAEAGVPPRKRYKGWAIAALGVFVLGALWVIIAVADAQVPSHYVEATGMVIVGGSDPVIRFDDATGSEVRFGDFTEAEEGEFLSVFYDPADPANTAETVEGRALETSGFFVAAAIAGVLALLLALAATWFFYAYRKAVHKGGHR